MKAHVVHILIWLSLFLSSPALGQQWEIGANFGGTGYMGDINPGDPFYYKNLGGGLHVQYNFDPTWGVRLGGNFLRINGADRDSKQVFQQNRNLVFNNDLLEIAAIGTFNFFRFVPSYDKYSFTPYLYTGIAGLHHSPYISYGGEKIRLMELMIDQNSYDSPASVNNWAIAIPYGFGVKYNLKGPWTIGAEIGYRSTFTNRLDNVSGRYAFRDDASGSRVPLTYLDLPESVQGKISEELWSVLADPSLGGRRADNAGRPRGSGGKYDGYMTAGLTITYSIVSTRCYWW